jgi:hypothetical protein
MTLTARPSGHAPPADHAPTRVGSRRMKPFFQRDTTAGVFVSVSLTAAVLVEWG